VFTYQSNITNATYILNTNKMSQTAAEGYCVDQGGHLVAYATETEQRDIEGYFYRSGFLFPTYHVLYWMGLIAKPVRAPNVGNFYWNDAAVKPPSAETYQRWGT
jgi:hypothetical protein